MYIIAGLGNPGKDYANTRHNCGFNVIDYLAEKMNIKMDKIKFKALYGEGFINNEKVILLKPQTFMNLSGESILDAVQFLKVEINNLIVIYDDVSIPVGKIRIKPDGSDGGHNGMKSIIGLLGSDSFARIRIGIGAPKGDMINYVIGNFTSEDKKIMKDIIEVVSDAIASILENGVNYAMNKYNGYKHSSLE